MYQGVQSHDRLVPFNNVQIFAKAAKLFKIPTVLSTVAADSFSRPFMPEVIDLFRNHTIIDRTSMNSRLDAGFRKAVAATGRKKFVICGLYRCESPSSPFSKPRFMRPNHSRTPNDARAIEDRPAEL